ncbi:MAG: hypothetical protein ACMUEL_03345 [Flavobacteriales bacterium Tduv]
MSKTRWGSRMYFWQYKALVWLRKTHYKRLDPVVHAQDIMEAMAPNLYRSPGIIMRCS